MVEKMEKSGKFLIKNWWKVPGLYGKSSGAVWKKSF